MQIENGLFKSVVENLHDGLYIVDRDKKISYWNRAAEKISGYSAEEVIGSSCADNILTHVDSEGNQLCLGGCPLEKAIQDGISREAEVYMHHKDGHRVPVSVRVSSLTDQNGNIIAGIELFTDISKQSANSLRIKELEKLALLDPLTQLSNRTHMERVIKIRLEEKRRLKVPFGIFFIDIDFFKNINDEYGHDVGDKVLKYVARTFTVHSRPFDVYGRWGGEEFVGIIRNITVQDLEIFGNRLRMLIERSYMVQDTDTVETVIKRVDTLMYEGKNAGRNRLILG
jgi:diguanylate cyclase (GGDEF)-like protein/PAS domain S-box-containing protein